MSTNTSNDNPHNITGTSEEIEKLAILALECVLSSIPSNNNEEKKMIWPTQPPLRYLTLLDEHGQQSFRYEGTSFNIEIVLLLM